MLIIYNRDINGDLMVINPLVMEYEWLVGGLEHELFFSFHSIQLGMSSSQLTNSIIFQICWNHQPVNMVQKASLFC